jgi:LmbE family N-acetylglucosaminyl deacetylase
VLGAPPRSRALVLAACADDEVIGCGGTLALHAEGEDEDGGGAGVRVAIAPGDPGSGVGEDVLVRRNEARAGGRRLGVRDYVFLAPDKDDVDGGGGLARFAARFAEMVIEYEPDVVYAPWLGEHHLARHVAARAARAALAACEFPGEAWGYEVRTPLVAARVVDVSRVWDRKIAALCEHASQLELGDLLHAATGMGAQRSLHLGPGARRAEAFAPLLIGLPADREELDTIARVRLMLGGRRACG